MKRRTAGSPSLPILSIGLLMAAMALAGCHPDAGQEMEDGSAASPAGAADAPDPEGALPPAPIGYADPGTVEDHSERGYDTLVDELEGGRHPEALFFYGILPCADCPGIRTKLTLVPDDRLYVLRRTYLEADEGRDATFTTVGAWSEEPGALDQRPDAPVFRLHAAEDAPPHMMLARTAVDTLRLLDREGRWIDSDLPYELIRVQD